MKKTISLFLATILLLFAALSASAEGKKPLTEICDSVFELLFDTGNVTLSGEASFSLDGMPFKTAGAKYIQDGDRSFWDLKLSSPKRDGTLLENGYTVIADGSKIYVMEVYHPGIYKTGTNGPQSTILRESVQMDLMKRLVRSLAEEADTLSGNSFISIEEKQAETTIRFVPDNQGPAWLNMSLNILAEYFAKRYFTVDYDQIAKQHMTRMSSYLTITEAVLRCTESVELKQAEATVRRDAKGRIEHISGFCAVSLHTAEDGTRTLEISFQADITDRGESRVEPFDPDAFGVQIADGAMDLDSMDNSEVDAHTQDRLIEQARQAWLQAGYTPDPDLYGYSYKLNGRFCTELIDERLNLFLSCITDREGKVLELRNTQNMWQEKTFIYDAPYPDSRLVEESAEKVMDYLRRANPESAQKIGRLKLQCWLEEDGELYFEFCEDPLAQDWDGILTVVRVKPDWQIMYYSCFANG